MSLRLEKFFGSWMREFRPDYMPCETGMDRFVSYNKPVEFIGKAAALAEKASGPTRKAVAFVVDAIDADVVADEPIYVNGTGRFCHQWGLRPWQPMLRCAGHDPDRIGSEGLKAEIEILGQRCAATLVTQPLFDADNARMRG